MISVRMNKLIDFLLFVFRSMFIEYIYDVYYGSCISILARQRKQNMKVSVSSDDRYLFYLKKSTNESVQFIIEASDFDHMFLRND